ncbi:Na/H antiporter [Aspergillus welwitschiae]|uniref:Na/H antiporter n=1 Tax=Aspergillus welwitschiae TaxID=1341132 RepID=A0A3F3PIL3_9EURO|nr:Na/H antiporter [Aspergillus welwitschiae]RDH26775.1 Na/H antiporter [Aspergillus welwitschiae]
MTTISLVNFNTVCATLGGFISLFGLLSFLCKEKFYLSKALISLLAGVVFSPNVANFIRPTEYALGSSQNVKIITLYFTRLVLGVQLFLAGVQLPKRYLQVEWKSLALLLGRGMTVMWNFVAACITRTDTVLSNSIFKGKFAERHVPRDLQSMIIAEPGANDGLGYPFLFLAIYLLKYTGMGGAGTSGGVGKAVGMWFYETWCYDILLSILFGVVVGWLSRTLLHWAEENGYVDRESFFVFAISLGLFTLGTCGLIGTDDLLACFVAGNVFTQDDWFRLETMDDSLQPTIDMPLNLSIFLWFGAVCPWSSFTDDSVIPLYRLLFLSILILLVRRMPAILAMHRSIHQIENLNQAAFVGFFGPTGVGAIFYLSVCQESLSKFTVDGEVRADAQRLSEAVDVIVWFLVVCSIVVHGLSIPLGKAGCHLPRTISNAFSNSSTQEPAVTPADLLQQPRSTATPLSHSEQFNA